jgi:dTDP-4-amino-4,6-dideoxygalactose transaminase
MLVHWGGYPNDLDKIQQIQEKAYSMYGFKPVIIEDGAHSFGSKYKGKTNRNPW